MGRRNHPTLSPAPKPSEAQYTSDADPRSTAEIVAGARRKAFFLLLALSAPPIAWTMSWFAEQSRRSALVGALPQGVSLDTPLPAPVDGAAPQTLGQRLEQLGAWISDGRLLDGENRPIEIRQTGAPTATAPPAAEPTAAPTPITIIEVPGAGASRSS